MKLIKRVIKFLTENVIEMLILVGMVFIFIGIYMIFEPAAYVALGLGALFLSYLIFKNQ